MYVSEGTCVCMICVSISPCDYICVCGCMSVHPIVASFAFVYVCLRMCGIWYEFVRVCLYVSVCSVYSVDRCLHVRLYNYVHVLVLLCVSLWGCVVWLYVYMCLHACVVRAGRRTKLPKFCFRHCANWEKWTSLVRQSSFTGRVWLAEWRLDFSPR